MSALFVFSQRSNIKRVTYWVSSSIYMVLKKRLSVNIRTCLQRKWWEQETSILMKKSRISSCWNFDAVTPLCRLVDKGGRMIISLKKHHKYALIWSLFWCAFQFLRHATSSSKMWRIPKESTISFTDTRNQSFRRQNKRIHCSVLTSSTACLYQKAIGQ